ncbi:response regulator transcription factor [Luteolibacter flavescens]|uniref:Response regulator transcription factor n=1 Tax=Luteolibacter flavescens TaxID=1859460 RepID=A0ABT3FN32_9BACT|nr:response regulator transcription factor [Luteolibacter flavescens]MCW1884395.1 response regulator transcription factor [Luteolibacter flavescens]
MTALVIDDEVQIRRLLKLALESRGYVIHEAENGQLGLQACAVHRPDVVLLDLGLPDLDGLEVLKRLREWSDVPVLILSVRDDEPQKIGALEAGADDYVTKPFATGELLARLAAIQRRRHGNDTPEIVFGPLLVRLDRHEAILKGYELKLTPTEFAFLRALVKHPGKIVTQRQLLREVWGPQAEEQTHYLRVYANLLRKKLGDLLLIRNEPGIGYRIVEPL